MTKLTIVVSQLPDADINSEDLLLLRLMNGEIAV